MSYDLYFTQPVISQEQFRSYFAGNSLYDVSPAQAVYQNKNRVYFVFDFNPSDSGDEGEIAYCVSFNLNYYRPHIFALEAVEEVTRFVKHFGFSIHDPQTDGMADGPYSPDGFLKGWNHGNTFGYSAVLQQENKPKQVWSLPSARLEAIWHWNFLKSSVQEAFTEDTFVPTILFVPVDAAVKSLVVWPDAISELIPEVDLIYIERDILAPKPFFGRRKKDSRVIPLESVRQILEPFRTENYSMPSYQLTARQKPKAVTDFIRSLQPAETKLTRIPADQVLNSELVERALKG